MSISHTSQFGPLRPCFIVFRPITYPIHMLKTPMHHVPPPMQRWVLLTNTKRRASHQRAVTLTTPHQPIPIRFNLRGNSDSINSNVLNIPGFATLSVSVTLLLLRVCLVETFYRRHHFTVKILPSIAHHRIAPRALH